MPTVSVESVSVAEPLDKATGESSAVEPSLNWTVPVGLLPATVAVNETACPTVMGFSEETILVVEVASVVLMTSLKTEEVLAALEVSPL